MALGFLTTPAAAAVIAVMTAAVITVHARNGFFIANGGFEYNLVLIAAAVALAGIGAGAWSLDGALGVGLTGIGWALAALGVGLVGGVASVVGGHRYPEAAHRGPGVRTPA